MKRIPSNPVRDLFIYYIEGRVPLEKEPAGSSFIGNWVEDDTSFLFFSKPADEIVEAALSDMPGLKLLDRYQMTYDEWHGERPSAFRTGDFWIVPPWEKSRRDGMVDGSSIILDPGVVFGAGNHPTTRDCIDFILYAFERNSVSTCLDLGSGTGILSLIPAKLGASRVLSVDFNFLAAKTTLRNIELNGLSDTILSICGRAEDYISWDADLLVANIHFDVMRKLLLSDGFRKKRIFILSGLLRDEARETERILRTYPVTHLKTKERDGVWHTFFGEMGA